MQFLDFLSSQRASEGDDKGKKSRTSTDWVITLQNCAQIFCMVCIYVETLILGFNKWSSKIPIVQIIWSAWNLPHHTPDTICCKPKLFFQLLLWNTLTKNTMSPKVPYGVYWWYNSVDCNNTGIQEDNYEQSTITGDNLSVIISFKVRKNYMLV